MTKNLLEEKENTIQALKKKLKVPGTQHVQLSELTVLQKEKEKIHQDLMDLREKCWNYRKKIKLGKLNSLD